MNGNFGRGPRGFGGPRRRVFAPVREGDEVDVKVVALGEKGDGIAKVKGFVIVVPNAQEGDEVRIKITRVLKKAAFGEVIGPAQGPVEPTEKEERGNAPAEEAPAEEPIEEPAEEPVEETPAEEEPKEEASAEEPAEEPAEEEPKEEAPAEESAEKEPKEEATEEEKKEE